ncbi:RICIN domain-containing protein [Lentzea sp. NPDC004782]|uniref:RICIN domain-containing protein n=1 Tax=Lentzea sp. NPDC004782 TaxID=3154458 RepID=UPI0033BE7FA6
MIRKLVALFAACAAVVLPAQPASAIVNPVVISLKNVQSALCMDVLGFNQNDGAGVVQWDCNGLDNQKFTLENRGDNEYALKVQFNGKCLDMPGNLADNVQVTVSRCHYDRNQIWFFERMADNPDQFQIRNKFTNKCLENGIQTEKNKPVFQFQCHQRSHQRWI